jgi:hypothetical protein
MSFVEAAHLLNDVYLQLFWWLASSAFLVASEQDARTTDHTEIANCVREACRLGLLRIANCLLRFYPTSIGFNQVN